MSTFLLEIGTEELPADFARLVLSQLSGVVTRDLDQNHISHGKIKCTTTPRRIVLVVEGLPKAAEDSQLEKKGPPASQSFDNGVPTKAAFGFASRFGLQPEDLIIQETSKGPFVFANIVEKGAPTDVLLREMIPDWIGKLQGRRFMRWGNGESRFSRPIRWIVALIDENVISFSLEGTDPQLIAGNISRGHRLYRDELVITSAKEYFTILKGAGIFLDRDSRYSYIQQLIINSASEIKAVPDLSEDLLNELTDLVESPSLVCGAFSESFLNLPSEVLCTVMKVHQRYVPLYVDNTIKDPLELKASQYLLPKFLCICNGLSSAKDIIRHGNERVLKARLADAEFFINSDLSINSSDRREALKNVTFSDGLGSLFDRVERIEWLSKSIFDSLQLSIDVDNILKAAYFCKHDLVSQMVGEFPELQGIIGAKYLIAEGETREVALAVLEHYSPRSASDDLPKSDEGSVLALAERVELLVSIFAKGERPSGSSDPYALRRAANGILQILWHKDWKLDLYNIISISLEYWALILPHLNINKSSLLDLVSEFCRQRVANLLEDNNIDQDIVQAVLGQTISVKRILSDPSDARDRAKLLMNMRESGELLAVYSVVTRASRITEKADLKLTSLSASNVVDPDLFESRSEQAVLEVLSSLEPFLTEISTSSYLNLAKGLAAGSEALSQFFDGKESVMVMTDDLKVRNNRLNLLKVLSNQANILADFSQLTN